jgi:hypothetical protein
MNGGGGDGGFVVPEGAMCDEALAEMAMGTGGNEFVMDMQSHFANDERNMAGAGLLAGFIGQITPARFPWMLRVDACVNGNSACYNRAAYAEQIMMGSDTTIGVLSGISYSLGADGTEGGEFDEGDIVWPDDFED